MPFRYANEDDVTAGIEADAAESGIDMEAVYRLENGLCDVFDHKIGRSFGTAAVAEMRTVWVGNTIAPYFWPIDYAYWGLRPSDRIILNVPLRSLTGIETGGTWNGTDWDDGTALDADDYRLTEHTNQGFYAIDLVNGTWSGVVRITGIWGDQSDATVPDDVREALTDLTINQWLTRQSSPAGLIGPEGFQVPTRNPWNLELVKAAIDRHRVVQVLV